MTDIHQRLLDAVHQPGDIEELALDAASEIEALRRRVAELETVIGNGAVEALGGPIWQAGYAACEADVVTYCEGRDGRSKNRSFYIANAVKAGNHRGAAARKGGE